MVNFNGVITSSDTNLSNSNRAFLYGDGVFETLKIVKGNILFFEDHYFRLMASMRIVRMQIPNSFTLEYLQQQILDLSAANNCSNAARVRFTVFRNDGGFYLPKTRDISFLIQVFPLENAMFQDSNHDYEVDLYKDFYVAKQLLSTIKTTNKMIHITGSIFAEENGFQNCLLLNNEKNVIEALNGNLFMLLGTTIITPPLEEGCVNGIMRKQIIQLIKKDMVGHELIEKAISPFDLQKADELFITNCIVGIQSVTKYRKKEYATIFAKKLRDQLNQLV